MGVTAVVDLGWIAAAVVVGLAIVALVVMGTRQRREWPTDLTTSAGGRHDHEVHDVVHVLAPGEAPAPRAPQPPPRIDPDRRYVFGEAASADAPAVWISASRHDTEWALRHASRGRQMPRGSLRVLIVAALALIALALIGASLQHGAPHHSPPTHHVGATGVP